MSLTAKFSLFIVFLVIVLTSAITAAFIFARLAQIRKDLTEKDRVISQIAIQDFSNSFADYYFYQYDTYRDFVRKKLSEYGDIVHFTMYGTNGEILFDSDQLNDPPGTPPPSLKQVTDKQLLSVIQAKKEAIQTVQFRKQSVIEIAEPFIDKYDAYRNMFLFQFSTQKITSAIQETIAYYSVSLVIFIIVGLSITYSLVRQIVKPIETLTKAAKDLSTGDLAYQIPITATDEIGTLGIAFNTMASDLKQSRVQLEEHNKKLEEEVEKRTKELQNQVDEMGRLQKITIDRELKMVEMKKELDELKSRLGS